MKAYDYTIAAINIEKRPRFMTAGSIREKTQDERGMNKPCKKKAERQNCVLGEVCETIVILAYSRFIREIFFGRL